MINSAVAPGGSNVYFYTWIWLCCHLNWASPWQLTTPLGLNTPPRPPCGSPPNDHAASEKSIKFDWESDGGKEDTWGAVLAGRVAAGTSWVGSGGSIPPLSTLQTCLSSGQLPRQGDDGLIQTYSSAGSPDGSVRTRSVKLSVLALVEDWLGEDEGSPTVWLIPKLKQNCFAALCLVFYCGPPAWSATPAHRLCLVLKQLCFMEPTGTPDIFGSKDFGLREFSFFFCSLLFLGKIFWPPRPFPPLLFVTLDFGPPELDFWYFTQARGLQGYM